MQSAQTRGSSAKELDGKAAVITGAGSGVGRAMANLFAQNGARVAVVDVVPERVDQVVAEVKAAGGSAFGMVLDLSTKTQAEKMIDDAAVRLGSIHILCNNAGIMDGVMPLADTTDEIWERVINVNLNAPFRASRRVLPQMLKQGGGVIINTASVAGLFGGIAGTAYTVSKHALIGLTRNVAAQYGKSGIRCNAMALGAIDTNIGVGSKTPSPLGMETLNKVVSMIPRVAEPREVAELALFLASERSSYVNGSCVVIDGGWTTF